MNENDALREWLVAGALLESDDGVLLVCNRRRDGRHDWSPPGGVIDPGETVLGGLTREVQEETGLAVSAWEGPVYEIEAEARGLGWRLRVEAYRATAYDGALAPDDPDQIVVDACFVAADACGPHLAQAHPWVREPLADWLVDRWSGRRRYTYRIDGTDRRSLTVERIMAAESARRSSLECESRIGEAGPRSERDEGEV